MAKLSGVKFGRPPVITPINFITVVDSYKKKLITSEEACKMNYLSRGTYLENFRKWISELPDLLLES